MEKFDTAEYPRHALPAGYAFAQYKPGLEAQWAALHCEVGQCDSIEEAETIFEREFMAPPDPTSLAGDVCHTPSQAKRAIPDAEALAGRMLFVLDESNLLAGTGCLWDGNHFGRTLQRLHWIAVSPGHQGRGIAKAIVSRLLDLYNELGYGGYIYLTSQTWSYRALNMYAGFGFRPYMGEKPVNWRCGDFAKESAEAWRMIFEKIAPSVTRGDSSLRSCRLHRSLTREPGD